MSSADGSTSRARRARVTPRPSAEVPSPSRSIRTPTSHIGEGCTFTVYAQNVTDQDTDDPPNLMAADYLATFQTVAAPPDQAPGVQSTSPDNGATDVARDASLSVTFDEPVDVTAGSFGISCTTSFAHAANITGGPLTFTLHPFNDFAYDETCTLTVNSPERDRPGHRRSARLHGGRLRRDIPDRGRATAGRRRARRPVDVARRWRHRCRSWREPVGDLQRTRRRRRRLVRHQVPKRVACRLSSAVVR